MAYVDIATLMSIAPGEPLPAAVVQQIRDNQEFFADPPACSVYNSTVQSIGHLSPTAMNADSEWFDNDSIHSTTVNNSRLTIQTAGRYLLFATVQFASNANGVRNAKFRVDGVTNYETMQVPASPASSSTLITSVRALALAAGQYVECIASHSAGSALNVTLLEFGVTWLTR